MKYAILDLCPVNQGDSIHETFEKSAAFAHEAELLGYTRYWLSEHHNMPNVASAATAVLIGFIASRTKSIRIGSGGIMLPNHSNLSIAEQFGTLAELYDGRIDLGLGRAPGTDGKTATILRLGNPFNTFYNFEANIKELKQYFSKTNAAASVRAIPGEGSQVPLYILGSSTDSAHLAARLGLPYAFAGHFAPGQFFAAMDIYRKEFQPSNVLQEPYAMGCVNIITADTDEEAAFLAKSYFNSVKNILTDNRQPVLPPDEITLNDISPELKSALLQWTALTFIGKPATIKKQLAEMVHASKIKEVIVHTTVYDFEAKKKSYQLAAEILKSL